MNRTATALTLGLLLGGAVLSAEPELEAGARLLEGCRAALSTSAAPSLAMDAGMCRGRVGTARDLLRTIQAVDTQAATSSPFRACIPESVTPGEAIAVVVTYLDTHPERLPMRASHLIVHALTQAYPCP